MNKLLYISLLNILAAFCVVLMHCTGGIYRNFQNTWSWELCALIGTISNFAVPMFFMITGANLLGYRDKYTTRAYIQKRVKKTLIPFLIWSVVPIAFYFIEGKYAIKDINFYWLWNMIINTKVNGTYWFFIPLFAVYLSIPVLSFIPNKLKKTYFTYLCLYSFITLSILPVLRELSSGNLILNGRINTPISGGFLLYALLGYLLAHEYTFNIKERLFIYCGGGHWVIIKNFWRRDVTSAGKIDPSI